MDYKDLIASNLSSVTGLDKAQVEGLIEIPPKLELGDFAFPCFVLAKTLHKAPPMIANELKDSEELVKGFDGAVTVDTAGPYINFRIDRGVLAKSVISFSPSPLSLRSSARATSTATEISVRART